MVVTIPYKDAYSHAVLRRAVILGQVEAIIVTFYGSDEDIVTVAHSTAYALFGHGCCDVLFTVTTHHLIV